MLIFLIATLMLSIMMACQSEKGGPKRAKKNWTFETSPVWFDEFDYTGKPSPEKWSYDIGGHGWGNKELQYYTDDSSNAWVADGKLIITARREKKEGNDYTSARLVTKNKGDWTYGRFEIKARLPAGRGTWAAIWMLPTDYAYGPWLKSGEIDIMEHVGYDQDQVHVTLHTEAYNSLLNNQRVTQTLVPQASTAFHLYRLDWTPEAIRGYIDNRQVFEYLNEGKGTAVWPFDQRFYLLLNIAVGGSWGGLKGVDPEVFPQSMEVDYVRVYRLLPQ